MDSRLITEGKVDSTNSKPIQARSKFVGAELVGTFAKILGEVGHNPHHLA